MKAEKTSAQTLRSQILEVFDEVYRGQRDGETPPSLDDETVLLETGLDSLGFAILVTLLDDKLGYDPFTISTEAYYPRTFGELVDFYFRNAPQ